MALSKKDLEAFHEIHAFEKQIARECKNDNGFMLDFSRNDPFEKAAELNQRHQKRAKTTYDIAYHHTDRQFALPASSLGAACHFSGGQLDPLNPDHQRAFGSWLVFLQTDTILNVGHSDDAIFILKTKQQERDRADSWIELPSSLIGASLSKIPRIGAMLSGKWKNGGPKIGEYITPMKDYYQQFAEKFVDQVPRILGDSEFTLSPEFNRILLKTRFESQQVPPVDAKKRSDNIEQDLSKYMKKFIEKDPTLNKQLKEKMIQEWKTLYGIDEPTAKSLASRMDKLEEQADKSLQFQADFENKQKQPELFSEPRDIAIKADYARGEIYGWAEGFQGMAMLARYTHSPGLMKTAQVGLGLANVALRVMDTIVAQAAHKATTIGLAALTGNYVGLAMSVASLIFPFLSQQGPTDAQRILDYLQPAFKHVDARFDHVDRRDDQQDHMLRQILGVLHDVIENQKRLGQQTHNFEKRTESSLETIQVLIKELHTLVEAGFEETQYQAFLTNLRQIQDVLEGKNTEYQDVPRLMNALVGDYIITMSQSRYHTRQFLFNRELTLNLTPLHDTLFFSASSRIDKDFVTNEGRYKQAVGFESHLKKMETNSGSFLGFLAAYAKTLLADELMDVTSIDEEIKKLNAKSHETTLQLDAVNAALKKDEKTTSRTPAGQEWWEGQIEKQSDKQRSLIHHGSRLGKLKSLRIIATLTEEKHKNRQAELSLSAQERANKKEALLQQLSARQEEAVVMDRVMENLISDCDFSTQTPVTPLPEEAKIWISTHQDIEALQLQLIMLDQEQRDHAFLSTFASNQGHPSFAVFNLPIWEVATEKYLKVLDNSNVSSFYHDTNNQNLHTIITMPENVLYLIEFFQNNPILFQHLWRSYANTLLFIHDVYEEQYQLHLAKPSFNTHDKEHKILESVVNPGRNRVGEKEFAQTLGNNTEFQRYVLILDSEKKILQRFLELVGCLPELINTINALPDQTSIPLQLKDSIKYGDRASFTQNTVYTQLTQAYKLIAKTFDPLQNLLPKPTATPIGSAIAPYLKRLYQHKHEKQMHLYVSQFADSHFTQTFSGDLTLLFPLDQSATQNTTSSRNAPFEALVTKSLQEADMHCIKNALLYVAKTGRAKSTAIARALGCELQYELHSDGFRRRVTIKRCPEGVIPPEIGQEETSHTLWPAAYVDKKHGVVHIDFPGFEENRGKDMHLLTMISTQVAVKTIDDVKGIVMPIMHDDFTEPKLLELYEAFKVIATLFKERTQQHGESLRILITHIPEDSSYPKPFFINKLKSLQGLIKENLAIRENEHDRAIDYYLSFFTKDGAEQHVLLFDPLSDDETLLRTYDNTASFPSTDLALIGPQTIKQEFISRLDQTLIESQHAFDVLLTTPQKIINLQQKERRLTTLIANLTEAPTEKNDSMVDFDQIENDITLRGNEIDEKLKEQSKLQTEQTELSANIATLEARTELVTFHEIKYHEREKFGDIKATKWVTFVDMCDMSSCYTYKEERPQNVVVHEYNAAWSGDPFTLAKEVKVAGACALGGSLGSYVPNSHPQAGTYSGIYKGPSWCYGELVIELQRPYNEQPEPKGQLKSWRSKFASNAKLETLLTTGISELRTAKLGLERDLSVAILARANKHVDSESLAVKLKAKVLKMAHQELVQTQKALTDQMTLQNQTMVDFHHDKPLYQSIHQLNELMNLNSSLCETFRNDYVKTLQLLNETDPNANMTRCHPEPAEISDNTHLMPESALSSSQSLQEQVCFVEDEPEPTTPFGFPGVDATTITCRPIMPKRPRLPDAHDANHTKPMPGLPIELEGFMGQIQHDPRTGVSVYPIYFFPPPRLAITAAKDTPFQPMRPLAHVKLYGVPFPCKSADGSQTNIVASKGKIPSAFLDPQAIEAVCDVLPPSLLDSGLKGVKQGLCRGAANVVGSMVCPSDTSKKTKQWVQSLIYNYCYFTWRCHTHLAKGKSIENTVYDAAIDTFWMCSIGLLCAIVNEIELKATRHDLKNLSGALSFFRHTAPLAYTAVQQEVIDINSRTLNADMLLDTGAYMLASTVTQAVVERAGNHYVNKLRN